MTITQMKYFISVVKHRSISKAAKENYVSPTSISMLLSNLNNLYNIKIFSKHGNTFKLTEEGKILYEKIIKVMNSYNDYEKTILLITEKTQTINIGVSHYLNTPSLQNLLSILISQFQDYKFNIQQMHSSNICSQIEENKLNLGIYFDVKNFTNFGKNINSSFLKEEEVIFVLDAKHQLASKKIVSFYDLEKIPLFFLNDAPEKVEDYKQIFKSFRKAYTVNICTTKLHLISMIMARKGGALFPKNFFTYRDNFKILKFFSPLIGEIKLGYEKNNGSLLKIVKFIENNFFNHI